MRILTNAVAFILSTAGLIIGGWFGYDLAGPIGVLVFTPLGALGGLLVSILNWRLLYLLG
ncbi:MAG: hypothetical protein EON58_14630 [Alphaproteobacteria bacterium]|nr:MAG: hypothetical protein EON58_14630 [Alphaproteobacteria bacterium]